MLTDRLIQLIMNTPKKEKVLLAVPNPLCAAQTKQYFELFPNVRVVTHGGVVCGYGADLVVAVVKLGWRADANLRDWINCSVRTKVFPGGDFVIWELAN